MISHHAENAVRKQTQVVLPAPCSAVEDFAIGVGGVRKGDTVVEISDCEDTLAEKLSLLGAKVILVDSWNLRLFPSLPMVSRRADAMFVNMVLHHMHYPTMVIAEMKRVLRPGGRLVIIDMGKYNSRQFKLQRNDRWMGFYSSDIRHWLNQAGFSNIIVSPVSFQQKIVYGETAVNSGDMGLLMATATA